MTEPQNTEPAADDTDGPENGAQIDAAAPEDTTALG